MMKLYQMQNAARYYQQGVMSLQEAAFQAKVPLYEMMAYVQKENIRPSPQNEGKIQDEIANGRKLVKK